MKFLAILSTLAVSIRLILHILLDKKDIEVLMVSKMIEEICKCA